MKLIMFANLAGGVGKTTSSLACAVAATEYGKKVLLIDADANAALTFANGVENPRITTKEFLSQEYPLETALIRTSERVSLLSSSSRLSSFETEKLISQEKFREVTKDFDLVIVDTASGPDYFLQYFAQLADLVIIPTTLEILPIRGALHAKDFVGAGGFEKKPHLLITMQSSGAGIEIPVQLSEDFEILEPVLTRDSAVSESQACGKSFLTTANHSEVAAQYREITYTLLEELKLI
ncbi:MAG: ParA family protein [Candidatus Nanopelagicaceae bacterium]|nr:ParA family protein [Candidatus Nanopelagicaceae bacterium]